MIKQTIAMIMLCLSGAMAQKVYAQVNLSTYSGYIQYKVFIVAKASQLGEEKQLKLASYFDSRDKQVKEMIKSGTSGTKLSSFYDNEDQELQKILTAKEFASYMVTTRGYSRLLEAITIEKELGLDEKTIANLLSFYNKQLLLTDSPEAVIRDWEESRLAELLSKTQLSNFIKLKEQKRQDKEASLEWQTLVKLKLAKGVDSNQFKQDYIDFQFKRSYARATLQGKKTNVRKDSVDRALHSVKPYLMRKIELYENTSPSKSQYSELIYNRVALKLSEEQVDSLVNRAYNLSVMVLDYNKKHRVASYLVAPYEQEGMLRILNKQQLHNFLVMKYKPQAQDDAENLWEDLKKNNLTAGVDQKIALRDLTDYQLNLIVARKKSRMIGTKEATYQEKMAEAAKPDLLVLLEEKKDSTIVNNAVKRNLAW